MKKIIKYLFVFILLFELLTPFLPVKAEEKHEKGDLSCPDKTKNGVTCKENKKGNEVISVEITTEKDGITITKIVKKTDVLGDYEVSFNINGTAPQNTSSEAYIVILFDTSNTFKNNIDDAIDAIMTFSNKFKNNSKYHLALVQFAGYSVAKNKPLSAQLSSNINQGKFVTTGFEKKFFCGFMDEKIYNGSGCVEKPDKSPHWFYSRIDAGLWKANSLFSSAPSDASKYIVIFGDGDYNKENWAGNWKSQVKILNDNYEDNLTYIALKYPGGHSNKMKDIIGEKGKYYNTEKNKNAMIDAFNKVADDIETEEKSRIFSGKLTDTIGQDFIYNNGKKTVSKSFKNITSVTMEPFIISIRRDAQEGWHNTNNRFVFKYDNDKKIECNDNPKVYWVPEVYEFTSCRDSSINVNMDVNEKLGTITFKDGQVKSYYNRVCRENLKSHLNINNTKEGNKKISIKERMGLSVDLYLSTTVTCTYNFNKEEFDKDKKYYEDELKKATGKNKNSIQKILDEFEKVEKQYNDNLKKDENQFSDYKERFKNQNAILTLKYNDKENEIINNAFVNNGDVVEKNKSCDASKSKCTITLNKTMMLKKECLSMENGSVTSCDANSNDLINGGNKHYLKPDKTSANISVKLSNLGIGQTAMINMKDENDPACNISITKRSSSIVYRQIELSDPFLQIQTKKQRSIGQNWKNKKYNFVKIIDSNTWSTNKIIEYQYEISKTDIEKIKKKYIIRRSRKLLRYRMWF